MKTYAIFFVVILLLLPACETETQRVEKTTRVVAGFTWVSIARINNGGEKIVFDSLAESGIVCGLEGSILYDVYVPKTQWKQAIEKLKTDPKLKGVWIHFN